MEFRSLRHHIPLSLALLFLASLSACLTSPSGPPVQEPTTITLSTYRIVFTAVDQHVRIDATVLDQDSRVIADATVHWRSADNAIARVSDRGVVTAARAGTTQITVSSGYATATATVSVEQAADSIEITPSSITLAQVGETGRFTAVVHDANDRIIPGAAVVWSSSNPEFVTVDANGLVTAVSPGHALITASTGGVSTSRPVYVEVAPEPSRIVLNLSEATLAAVGQSLQLDAQVYDSNGAAIPGAAVTWSSNHPDVATVDATGLVIAVSNGTTRITVSSGGASAHATIHVVIEGTEPPPEPPPEPSIDRETLIAFYHATGGPEWENQANWLSEQSLAEWHGVGIVVNGRVGSIRLDQNLLTGKIPSVLGRLDELLRLTLKSNDLTGPIPKELGQLSRLSSLELTGNRLSGPIPPELGALSNLEFLELDSNRLSGEIPTELGNLSNLKVLDLEYNAGLTGPLPLSLTGLNLTDLLLHTTQLCVPSEETFKTWLDGIETKSGIAFCEDEPDPSSDRDALIALYEATDGANWTDNTNWLSDKPLGEWHGVTTDNVVKVIELDLLDNNLTGSLPPEIGQLRHIRLLRLTENRLSGPLPPEIGRLRSLERLIILRNQLSGEIPPEIGQLGNLTALMLATNRFSGSIPSEIGNLKSLWSLSLQNNQLSGEIPPETGNLISLKYLTISNNQLSGSIPPEIGNLSMLRDLTVSNNQLSGSIPPEIGNLKSLEIIELNQNAFSGEIPSEIWDLKALERIILYHNGFTGEIPPEIGNLNALEILHIGNNKLSGRIPREIGRLTDLEGLFLNNNVHLGGPLPAQITSISTLNDLALNGTGLCVPSNDTFRAWLAGIERTYDIMYCADDPEPPPPEPLSERDALVALYHATDGPNWTNNTNWLSDAPVGTWHGVSTNNDQRVVFLDLIDNNLTGTIPPEIGQLEMLTGLLLLYNNLTGPIPPEIGQLRNLGQLTLPHNKLTGVIPSEIGNLDALWYLNVGDNQLTGPFPAAVLQLDTLQSLYLYENQLSGKIPPEIGNLNALEVLHVAHNRFSGNIPSEIGKLTALKSLALDGNDLSGEIPPEIGKLANLNYLNLARTGLSGNIPSEIGGLTELRSLLLGYNRLTGGIPPEIRNLAKLRLLWMHRNQLTGGIPPAIGNLTELESLSLYDNQLTGGIPPEIGKITKLEWWNMSNNVSMSGSLPDEVTNIPSLDYLYLEGTGICAPDNAAFDEWLGNLEDYRIDRCIP